MTIPRAERDRLFLITDIQLALSLKAILAFQASYFSRDDQALLGFSKYFRKASDEEREHGMKLMEYQVNIYPFIPQPAWLIAD